MAAILVVDDELSLAELLAEILSNNGHAPEIANEGKTALAKMKKTRYGLVILDMHMPGISGIDVVKVMRASPELKAVPVLMCTSESLMREVETAYAVGANGYIIKPYQADRLLQKVSELLAKKS